MKNFDDYKTKVKYADKRDFTAYHVYKNGEVIFRNAEKSDITRNLGINEGITISKGLDFMSDLKKHGYMVEKVVDEEAYRAAKKNYYDDMNKLTEEFKNDLFEEFGVSDNPKRYKAYNYAWDKGHHAGFSEVYAVFSDVVDLIED